MPSRREDPAGAAPARHAAGVRAGLAILFLVAALHAWAAKARGGQDFGVLLTAGGRALRGETLYRVSDGHWAFKYTPPVALLFAPLSLLPADVASLALALGSAAALVAIFSWSARATGAGERPASHLLVVALSAPYTLHLLALGQNDALLVGLAVASESMAALHPWCSGALLGLACLVKPPFLVLSGLAFACREGRRLGGVAAGLALAFGATALRYGLVGLAAEVQGWRALLAATTPQLLCNEQNQSLWAVVCTYGPHPADGPAYSLVVALTAVALAAAAIGLASVGSRLPRRRRLLLFAASLYLTAAMSPLGWRANLVAAIPALFVLVENGRTASSRPVRLLSWTAIALALAVGLASYDVVGRAAFFSLLQHRHYALACGGAVLVALLGAALEARSGDTASARG